MIFLSDYHLICQALQQNCVVIHTDWSCRGVNEECCCRLWRVVQTARVPLFVGPVRSVPPPLWRSRWLRRLQRWESVCVCHRRAAVSWRSVCVCRESVWRTQRLSVRHRWAHLSCQRYPCKTGFALRFWNQMYYAHILMLISSKSAVIRN